MNINFIVSEHANVNSNIFHEDFLVTPVAYIKFQNKHHFGWLEIQVFLWDIYKARVCLTVEHN